MSSICSGICFVAQENISGKVRIKTGKPALGLFLKHSFNVITAFDVIEHIPDFKQTLNWWHYWLKPGGYLIMTTPSLDAWDAKLLGKKWYGFTKAYQGEHVNYFGELSLGLALQETGFKVKQFRQWGFVRSVDYLLGQLLNRKISWLPWSIYVPMTDLLVVARRLTGN